MMINKAHSYSDLGNYSAAYSTFHAAREITPQSDTLLQCFGSCKLAQLFWYADLPEIAIEYMHKVQAYHPTLFQYKQTNLPWPIPGL